MRFIGRWGFHIFVVCLLMIATKSAMAQATGRLGGTITDETGAVIPGATVTSKNAQTGLTRSLQTNQDGIFQFPDLPIGSYSLEATKEGFTS